ncbi:hypothetical protein SpCBS45565_g00792 [Spizellomyces sp. 'palustris']|nr:hypothetical protein SpCBS45565_g00792 [Spizellomyces sp. 'palustris']
MDHMLPTRYHAVVNGFGLLQISIALAHCFSKRRYFPAESPVSFRFVSQFRLHLVLYIIFYTFELIQTDIIRSFTNMALHHLIAIVIFAGFLSEFNTVSVITLTPFLFHALYWTVGYGRVYHLLALYNLALLVDFVLLLTNNLSKRKFCASVSYRLLACVLAEINVNAFTYCWNYSGSHCPKVDDRGWADIGKLSAWIGTLDLCLMGFAWITSNLLDSTRREQ